MMRRSTSSRYTTANKQQPSANIRPVDGNEYNRMNIAINGSASFFNVMSRFY